MYMYHVCVCARARACAYTVKLDFLFIGGPRDSVSGGFGVPM